MYIIINITRQVVGMDWAWVQNKNATVSMMCKGRKRKREKKNKNIIKKVICLFVNSEKHILIYYEMIETDTFRAKKKLFFFLLHRQRKAFALLSDMETC